MPIPIASYGNNANVGSGVRDGLLPEYEIVHGATDLSSALSEIPALVGGDLSVKPSSGLGTNKDGESQIPKAVIVGGSISEDEFAQLQAAVKGVPVVRVSKDDIVAAGGSGPDPVLISKLIKDKLNALGL